MRIGDTTRLYSTTIRHVRTEPVRHDFRHRSYSWFVDLDELPSMGWLNALAGFEARDHIGAPEATLRENLDCFLATRGVDLRGGRITMLANARVLGYVFNPISVFWCHRLGGGLECVVVEVHNTYGGRHAYLVRPDAQGRTSTDKELYVSPFNDVSGSYDLYLPEPGRHARISVTLQRPGQPPFVATLSGRVREATTATILRTAMTRPLEPLAVMARIKLHGIRLWLRGLPVQPRPTQPRLTHSRQDAVQ